MASTMARTSCSEALTSGRSGRTPGVSDEVLMQFLRPRIYRSTWAGERQQEAPHENSLWGLVFTQSGRRDLNPRPPPGTPCARLVNGVTTKSSSYAMLRFIDSYAP